MFGAMIIGRLLSHPVFGEGRVGSWVGSHPTCRPAERSPTLPSPEGGGAMRTALRLTLIAAVVVASPTLAQVESNDPGIVSGTLARIKKTGSVRIGYRDASIPFSYLDRSGKPVGYS